MISKQEYPREVISMELGPFYNRYLHVYKLMLGAYMCVSISIVIKSKPVMYSSHSKKVIYVQANFFFSACDVDL